MIPGLKEKLTKILLDKRLIKEEDLKAALSAQRDKGGSLSDILVGMGFLSKNDLVMVISEQLGMPPINLARYKIDPSVVQLIPKKAARQYKIMPVSKMGDTLTLAIADPLNIFAIDDIKALTGLKIVPIITTEKEIYEAHGQY